MDEKMILDKGNIKISDEVISTIATIAVSEVNGVYGMGGSFTGDIVEKFGKKTLTKGVKITMDNNTDVILDLNVILNFGVRIPEIAWNIQENVKKSVESMTGLNVTKVNVRIVGIEVENKEKTVEKSTEKTISKNSEDIDENN